MPPLGGAAKCPKCLQPVYFADEVSAKGKKWHKSCLACGVCSKALDSFSMNEREGSLYCKVCFSKVGGGNSSSSSSSGAFGSAQADLQRRSSSVVGLGENGDSARSSNGCPRCGRPVFFAEEKLAFGKKWHKMCFKCAECGKLLDSSSTAERDGEAYCRPCYGKLYGPKGYGFAGGSAGLSANLDSRYADEASLSNSFAEAQAGPLLRRQSTAGGAGPICPRCGTAVYFAEEVIAVGSKWHKMCLKCVVCSKLLDGGSVQEHMGAPHCKACYGKVHGPKGYGFGGVGAGLSANQNDELSSSGSKPSSYAEAQAAPLLRRQSTVGGGGPQCPGCGTTVYFAEEVIAVGRKWHKLCLKCTACTKLLDSGSVQEHMGTPHCKACYGKRHGPRGYGFGGVGAGLAANREGDGGSSGEAPEKPSSYAEAQAAPLLRRQSTVGSGPSCRGCGGVVYFAEEVTAVGGKWHKLCLKCDSCGKLLDSGSVQEHAGVPHCKTCYGKRHGPRGFGFGGVGAGLAANREGDGYNEDGPLQSSFAEAQAAPLFRRQSSIGGGTAGSAGGGPQCPRCGNAVYFAEEVIAAGRKWHKLCLKCGACSKLLDGAAVQEHDGVPYCRTCYGRSFGPKGYGFAGGAAGLSANRDDDDAALPEASRQLQPGEEIWSPSDGATEDGDRREQPAVLAADAGYAYSVDELGASVDRMTWHDDSLLTDTDRNGLPGDGYSCSACQGEVAPENAVEYQGDIYCVTCWNEECSANYGGEQAGSSYYGSEAATLDAANSTTEWL